MSTVAAPKVFDSAAFEAFLAERREPAWLVELRRAAFAKFQELPTPSRREEEWMRTDIRLFRLEKFAPQAAASEVQTGGTFPAPLLSAGVELGGSMTVVNGRVADAGCDADLASRGVLFGSLETLVAEHGDKLRPYFERKLVNSSADKFAALHA